MSQNPFILNRFLHYIIAFFVCQSNSDKITVKSVIKERIAGDPPAIQQKNTSGTSFAERPGGGYG